MLAQKNLLEKTSNDTACVSRSFGAKSSKPNRAFALEGIGQIEKI